MRDVQTFSLPKGGLKLLKDEVKKLKRNDDSISLSSLVASKLFTRDKQNKLILK